VKRAFRFLSLAAALGAGSLGLTACDASPYAVKVGGQQVTVNGFNHQLAQFTASPAFVQYFNQQAAGSTAAAGGTGGPTVAGAGGQGTYSTAFADFVLNLDIHVYAVHQYVQASAHPATSDQMVAARGVLEEQIPQFWDQFPEPIRELLVQEDADLAALTPVPTDLSAVQSAYQQVAPYIFSQVCLQIATVPDQASAQQTIATGIVPGSVNCYNQTQLEAQPAEFQTAVLKLGTDGQISAPLQTSYGYQVLQLVKRTGPGLSPGVAQLLASANNAPSTTNIVTAAQVKINPMYGSWFQGCLVPPGESAQQACGQQQQ
jgi:hypothetical protein